MRRHGLRWGLLILALAAVALVVLVPRGRRVARKAAVATVQRVRGRQTVEQRLAQYGPAARERLAPWFRQAGVDYPPAQVTLVGLKQERRLEVHAADKGGEWRFIRAYPILAASGNLGPKLKYGDCQVPEGLYEVESLNPNSRFHLSLRLSYPNEFDRTKAAQEKRTDLGGDIMIHGSNVSVGCLAMGDEAAEELFVLAAETKQRPVRVVLAPVDLRKSKLARGLDLPPWTAELYRQVYQELERLPKPDARSLRRSVRQ